MKELTLGTYEASDRQQLFELMQRVGRSHIDEAEFTWLLERNPASPALISVARAQHAVVGMLAMIFLRVYADGKEHIAAVPVHAATEPDYRRRGVFSALELHNEQHAAAGGAALAIAFPNPVTDVIFRGLGWQRLPSLRIWARLVRPASTARRRSGGDGLLPRSHDAWHIGDLRIEVLQRFGSETDAAWRRGASGLQFVRDATFLNWRYVDSPRDYRCFGAYRGSTFVGYAIVGHTVKHGVSSGFLADLAALGGPERVALLRRCIGELTPGTPALIALVPRAERRSFLRLGFLPTPKRIRVVSKALSAEPSSAAWHLTLGDLDFF